MGSALGPASWKNTWAVRRSWDIKLGLVSAAPTLPPLPCLMVCVVSICETMVHNFQSRHHVWTVCMFGIIILFLRFQVPLRVALIIE